MSKKRKIVVIGSNSFSGSDFIDLLLDDDQNQVIGISRSQEKSDIFLPYKRKKNIDFKFFQLDLNKDLDDIIELIISFKADYIVNFASQSEVAPSWMNPDHWFQTNAVALTRLVHKLKDYKNLKRYVHISSPEVYGTCVGRVKEDAPFNPSTPYAASKAAGDLSLLTFYKQYNFPLVTIRSTNVYGAYQQLFKIIPRSVIYIKKGKTIELHGGGNAVKSYIHIRDVSNGELKAMLNGEIGHIYHISPEKGIAVKDVVKTICKSMEVDFNKVTKTVDERPGQDAAYVIDSGKIRNDFNWKPEISIEKGISRVIQWICDSWDDIKKQPLEYIHKE